MMTWTLLQGLAWPFAILMAWLLGEYLYQWLRVPRISVYAFVGFALASDQAGLLSVTVSESTLLLANIAFAFILFECGYRINLRWLRNNPWLPVTSVVESALTLIAVYSVAVWFGQPRSYALLMASLAMASSPATIVRMINERRSSGQVTERVLHLSALNCTWALLLFNAGVGLMVLRTSGNWWGAAYASVLVLAASVLVGAIFGYLIPWALRSINRVSHDSTLAFALALILLVALMHSLKLSPVLAALTFGLVARHRRMVLSHSSKRGFGPLGDMAAIMLFVFVAATLKWQEVVPYLGLAFAIIMARQLAKIVGVTLFAHISGITWRKGFFAGVATVPMSAFVILVLEQTRYMGVDLLRDLAPLAAAALMLEMVGPILLHLALVGAREVQRDEEK